MVDKPHTSIKFDDSMINPSRIESAPGFRHNKYPEHPKRKIVFLYNHENNLLPFINRKKLFEDKQQRYFPKYRKKYNDTNFYESPEWLLLANNPDLPEGSIHSKLWLMIKCLARDNKLDLEKLQTKAIELGYNEVIDTPAPEVQYNPWTMFNWAMSQAEFCYKRKIVLPFPFDKIRYIVKDINYDTLLGEKAILVAMTKIDDFAGVMRYIRDFNRQCARMEGEKLIIFEEMMWRNIRNSITDKYLYDYIEFLNLRDFISGDYHKLESNGDE
jgi:hypothetical protein